MKRRYINLLCAFVALAVFLIGPFPALAQVAPNLGSAAPYAVLGANSVPTIGTVTCTNTGPAIGIFGRVGTTFAGGITNAPPCAITGPIDSPVAGSVVTDFNAAFASIDTLNPVCTGTIPIVTTTLAPGVYCSDAGTTIPTGVTLTLNGSASDVWIFRVGTLGPGALTVNSGQVVMGGAAQACNVFWKTSAGMTVTNSASFVGTVLSGAAATMTGTNWIGRMMATTDVTLTDPSPMTFAGCSAPATITVNKDFIPNNAATVPVALSCTSGTVTATPLNAAEGAPAVFTVSGALLGATCTATETVPAGYTANQANCVNVALNGSCTITNTLTAAPPPAGLTCPPVNALTAGGAGLVETVTLTSPAPVGGTVVILTSSAPGTASVPVSVVVPAGATSVSFTITPGATPGSVTITATTGGGSVTCTAVVGPAFFPGGARGGPTLDPLGLSILVLLLAAAGVLLVNRMRL